MSSFRFEQHGSVGKLILLGDAAGSGDAEPVFATLGDLPSCPLRAVVMPLSPPKRFGSVPEISRGVDAVIAASPRDVDTVAECLVHLIVSETLIGVDIEDHFETYEPSSGPISPAF